MRSAAPLMACVTLLVGLAAGCESDGSGEASADALGRGHYLRETATDNLSVIIRIPEPVRTLPGVGARLVAEAEAQAADLERRAAERRSEQGAAFAPSQLVIDWSVVYDGGDVISALGEVFLYEGGLIVSERRETLLFDTAAGREIGLATLFADPRESGPAMTALSEAAFAAWMQASPHVRGDLALVDEGMLVDARETLRPRASSFEVFLLTPAANDPGRIAGVTLLYPPGVLGPQADGPYNLFVPASAIAPHLAPGWAARLGLGA